jgi:hypothetical protein
MNCQMSKGYLKRVDTVVSDVADVSRTGNATGWDLSVWWLDVSLRRHKL